MDRYEKIGYFILGAVVLLYILAMVVGLFAILPFGLIGLAIFVGLGTLVVKVLRERAANKEDDYYSEKVEK